MLPDRLQKEIGAAIGARFGAAARVEAVRAVGGGCISNTTRVRTTSGDVFLKWAGRGDLPSGIFAAESDALDKLAETQAVRVPEVIALSDDHNAQFGWLLLEWLEPGRIGRAAWENLGHSLAAMHRASSDRFGWPAANFIGSLPQSNNWKADWPEFWRDERILPQLEMATASRRMDARARRRIETLLQHVDELASTGNADGPSLLHGDLWGGNVHGLATGAAALIDPSSYYGHREVDLAMAALFGGFDARFFSAYEEAWPLHANAQQRRQLYQLYYLLVHVNLFGGSYVGSAMASVEKLGF